jgi:hypothetical protein
MRSLVEFLSTDVKLNEGFPLSTKQDEIINFLKRNNFKHIILLDSDSAFEKISTNNTTRVFMFGDGAFQQGIWIRFCDTGKITKENPVFECRASKDGKLIMKNRYYIEFPGPNENSLHDSITIESIEEFKKIVDKHFGW